MTEELQLDNWYIEARPFCGDSIMRNIGDFKIFRNDKRKSKFGTEFSSVLPIKSVKALSNRVVILCRF